MEIYNSSIFTAAPGETEVDRGHRALWRVVAPAMFALVAIGGMVANTLVVYRICCRGRRKALDLLFLGLAISSMIFYLTVVPLTGYTYITNTWALGDVVCRLYRTAMFALVCCNAYTMVLLCGHAMEGDPRECCALQSRRSVALMSFLIWVLMFLITAPVYFLSAARQIENYSYCSIEKYHDAILVTFDVISYLIPVFVGIILSGRGCATRPNDTPKTTCKVATSVLIGFTIMWLPLHLNNILALLLYLPSTLWYTAWRIAATAIAYANFFVTPILYLSLTAGPGSHPSRRSEANGPSTEMDRYKMDSA